jgi:DNA mismatch repair protein MutL
MTFAAEMVERGGSISIERHLAHAMATMACHSSVRAGQPLSLEQMKKLLEEMDLFPLSSFCPHGRPVSVEYSFHELEKDFGRIV